MCFILAICLLSITDATAKERKPWVVRSINKLGAFIDTLAQRNIDHRYIEVPKRPWQIVLKFNANDMNLRSTTDIREYSALGENSRINMETKLKPSFTSSIGAWVGYRGYGLGYSFSLTGNNGTYLSIGATGSNYGINIRSRKFTTRKMNLELWGTIYDEPIHLEDDDCRVYDDIHVKNVFIDGYYLLNGKHFSYAAAYDQSVIQIRSAGSLIIGAMWQYSSLDYSNRLNAMVVQCMNNVGRITTHEGSIGVGYAYNWVPVKKLLVSAMAIPMVSLYNRTKAYIYDSNYDIFLDKDRNGKKAYPEDDEDMSWTKDVTLEEVDSKVKYGKISLNFDARLSITYNWERYFFNIYGQWNHSRYKIDDNKIRINDWFINASVGLRL